MKTDPKSKPAAFVRVWLILCMLTLLLSLGLMPGHALAQTDQVQLAVAPTDVGLSGVVRPGEWNPLRMRVTNLGAEPRQVVCQWIVPDIDGDPVYYERRATLSPQRQQSVWVYAALPVTTSPQTSWQVQVLDDKSGDVLVGQSVTPTRELVLGRQHRAVGITGGVTMGLLPYTTEWTQHEGAVLIRDLNPPDLPDRWYGYSGLRTLIWTPQGGDPTNADIPPQTLEALQEWVERGGHLVVVLPAIGDTWTGSPLGSILPQARMTTLTGVEDVPTFLGSPVAGRGQTVAIDMKLLQPPSDSSATVLLRDALDQPLCIAHAVGFGRVTLLGVDLTDPALARLSLPNGNTLWRTIFGWQGEAYSSTYIESLKKTDQISPMTFRVSDTLDQFLHTKISMQATTSTALLLALLLFGVYWLVAGPGIFAVLKKRGQVRHAWLGFVGAIGVFAAIAWGGAVVLRPSTTAVEHFTVVDARAELPEVRTQSWATLFVPDHGQVRIQLATDDQEQSHDLLSNVGLEADERGNFLGRQRYTVPAGAPHTINPPMRSTAKGLQIHYQGNLENDSKFVEEDWIMPAGNFRRAADGFPDGSVSHGLPQPLENLLVVFTLGDGSAPIVWRRLQPWKPGEVLNINKSAMIPAAPAANQPARPMYQRLWIRPTGSDPKRQWGGHLQDLIRDRPGAVQQFAQGAQASITDDRVIRLVEMLTFYEALPTPTWWRTGISDRPVMLRRRFARALDRSEQLALDRIHLVGYLRDATLPAPLAVDGRTPPSKGWVIVRWSAPLPPQN